MIGGISKNVVSVRPSVRLQRCKVDAVFGTVSLTLLIAWSHRVSNKGCEAVCKVCEFFRGAKSHEQDLARSGFKCEVCWTMRTLLVVVMPSTVRNPETVQ